MTRRSPLPAAGDAQSARRFAAGLGPRAFVLLALGLFWLIPAAFDRRAVLAMAAWDIGVLVLALIDLRRMPAPGSLRVTRAWSEALTIDAPAEATLVVRNGGGADVSVRCTDYGHPLLRRDAVTIVLEVAPGAEAAGRYTVVPRQRGDIPLGPAVLEWRTRWNMAERWATAPIEQTVRVYPDLGEGRRESLFLIRSRQVALEKRRARHTGGGREFESLRDYRPGDDKRDVCWTASARRARLVTRVYQPERSQAVWMLVDAGRLLRARAGSQTLLDHAVRSALTLAQVAMASGDRIGLLAYGRRVQRRLPPGRGGGHLRAVVEALAAVQAESLEADHAGAAAEVLRVQKRRALIVWLTDVAETAGVPDVIEQTMTMAPRHVVVFAVMRQPEVRALAAGVPSSAADMYRVLSAQETIERREALLYGLRQRGVLVVEGTPAEFSAGVVDRYLEIKARGLL